MTNPTNPLLAALEKCPLCGKSPVLAQVKAGIKWWQVECDAERGDGCGLSISRSTEQSAIAAWNRRVLSSAPAVGEAVAYRYVHHDYMGRKVSRYGTHPERVNGHDPIEVHPLYAHPTAAVAGDGGRCEKCDDSGYQVINGKQGFCDCACGHDAMDQAEGKGLHAPSPHQLDPMSEAGAKLTYDDMLKLAQSLGYPSILQALEATVPETEVVKKNIPGITGFSCGDAAVTIRFSSEDAADRYASRIGRPDETLRRAVEGIADDYMTSETHHPGYVLIPTWKFEQIVASLASTKSSDADGGEA